VNELGAFLAQAVVLSLSGSLAPGPVTAATLLAGTRRQHAGFLLAVGHGIVELPLMAVIMLIAGAGDVLRSQAFRTVVGAIGGLALLAMAAMMLVGTFRARAGVPRARAPIVLPAAPVWSGLLLTITSPYFLVWWATVGLALSTRAAELGAAALGLFAIVHWTCDAVWLEILSLASHRGSRVMGPRGETIIAVGCAIAMAVFGGWFLLDAIR
jgi:threonine/homoserine/homoserine lactone efflux protein